MRSRAALRPEVMDIRRLHLVMVPVTDADRAIAFYEALGLVKRVDGPMGDGERWVELNPPDGVAGIALVPGSPATSGVDTGIVLTTDDLDATHTALRERGLDADRVIARPGGDEPMRIGAATIIGPTPAMFRVRDPDGNSLLLVAS
jgi:catechol 2,3-dioxygenase-like lactoylglutathione lyase family enzyme